MSSETKNLRKEQEAFEAQLPELLKRHRGEFVVFYHGQPWEFFDTYDVAFSRASAKFGKSKRFSR